MDLQSDFAKLKADISILGADIYKDIKSTGVTDAINAVVKADLQAAMPQIMSDLQAGGKLFAQNARAGMESFVSSLETNMTDAQKAIVDSAFAKTEDNVAAIAERVWNKDMQTAINNVGNYLTKAIEDKGTSFDATWLSTEILFQISPGISNAAVDVLVDREFCNVLRDSLHAAEDTGAIVSPTSSQITKFNSKLNSSVFDALDSTSKTLENQINPYLEKTGADVEKVIADYLPAAINAIFGDWKIMKDVTKVAQDTANVVKSTAKKAKNFFKKLFS